MPLIYIDTNVFIDLFESRKDKFRDLGDMALFALRQVRLGIHQLVISDWVIEELKKYGYEEDINSLIADLPESQVIKIATTTEDRKEARKLSNTNYPDALHAILAIKSNCSYLVTRNIQDFFEFNNYLEKNKVEITLPEDL